MGVPTAEQYKVLSRLANGWEIRTQNKQNVWWKAPDQAFGDPSIRQDNLCSSKNLDRLQKEGWLSKIGDNFFLTEEGSKTQKSYVGQFPAEEDPSPPSCCSAPKRNFLRDLLNS
jgi:hypothetical protein